MSGPVNTLAQIWLWRLEAQVLGAVVVCLFLAIWVVVYALFGEGAGTGLIFAFFIGCGAVIVFSLGRALYLALSPGAGLRQMDRYLAEVDAAHRDRFG